MTACSIQDIIPDIVDFGIIPQKSDVLSNAYMGNNVSMTKLWSGHLFLTFTNDMITAPHLIKIGMNEPHNTRALMSLVKSGDVVVDIGANVGYFSVLAGWQIYPDGQLWAFEPNPNIYGILSDNLFINGYKGMMHLHKEALSDQNGSAQMRIFPGYEATSSIRAMSNEFIQHTANETGRDSYLIDVETVRLDDVMRDVPEINVMKIDAEGHEPAIMRGAEAILRRSPNIKILMEFVPPIMGAEETREHVAFLRSLGFSFHHIQFDGLIRRDLEDQELLSASFLDLLLVKGGGTD